MSFRRTFLLLIFLLSIFFAERTRAQLSVSSGFTPQQLVQNVLIGNGVSATNITYSGAPLAIGKFNGMMSNIGLASGVLLTNGSINNAPGPNNLPDAQTANGEPGDPDLDALLAGTGNVTFDRSVLEFDFVPQTNFIQFNYVFASEEYNEYVCANVNDIFAFFISGPGIVGAPNIATLPGGLPVAIDNVNNGSVGSNGTAGPNCHLGNSAYFVDNDSPPGPTVQYDGFTVVLTASCIVQKCQSYHIKIAIADVGDQIFDSGVFLEAGSFSSGTTVHASANANGGATIFSCAPTIVQFNNASTGTNQFIWHFGDGTASNLANPSHVYLNNGNYNVTLYAIDTSACQNNDTLIFPITIGNSQLAANFTTSTQRFCDSLSVTLHNTSIAANQISWNLGDGTTATGNVVHHSYHTPGDYIVVLTAVDTVCNVTKTHRDTIQVTPWVHVTASCAENIDAGCTPLTVNFTSAVTGTSSLLWNFGDGTAFATVPNPAHVFQTAGDFLIFLYITDTSICHHSIIDTLRMHTITSALNPSFALVGTRYCDSLNVQLTNTSVGAHQYKWLFSDGSSAQSTNSAHTFHNPGNYTVQLIGMDTVCNVSDTVTQNVEIIASPVVTAQATPDTMTGCVPLSINFSNTSINTSEFIWSFDDSTSQSILQNPSHTFNSSGPYNVQLIAVDTSICHRSDTMYVNIAPINPQPVASFTAVPLSVCDSLVLNFTNTSLYSQTWHWNFGDGNTDSIGFIHHTYVDWGTYTVTLNVLDTICLQTATTQQVFYLPPHIVLGIGSDTTQGCDPFTINLINATTGTDQYTWSFSDGSSSETTTQPSHTFYGAGNYNIHLVATDTTACHHNKMTDIPVHVFNSSVITTFNLQASNGCDSLTVDLSNTSFGAQIYLWDFGDGSTSSDALIHHVYHTPGDYTIQLTGHDSVCGATDFTSQVVTLLPRIIATAQTDVTEGCDPLTINYNDPDTISPNALFLWSLGNGEYSTSKNGTITFPEGTYNVLLTVQQDHTCNFSDTASFTIKVNPQPVAEFVIPEEIVLEDQIRFTNQSLKGITYQWDFGDQTFSDAVNPIHLFPDSGDYQICLTTTNGNCIDTTCKNLRVKEFVADLFIPNSFTPNHDGRNDNFAPLALNVASIDFSIFDRWGMEVFHTATFGTAWDGKHNGIDSPSDVYVYRVKAVLADGKKIEKIGHVTIVR